MRNMYYYHLLVVKVTLSSYDYLPILFFPF